MPVRRPFITESGTIFPEKVNPREAGARVDFRPDIPFSNQIEWHGLRLGWVRMALCPCKAFNRQTDQIEPGCNLCNGLGWIPFKTPGYFLDLAKTGPLNEVQAHLVSKNQAMVIRGLTMGMTEQPNMFSMLGDWAMGSVMITVRPENKLGYYDRLIALDDLFVHRELLTQGTEDTLKLFYPAESLLTLLTTDENDVVTYWGDNDVELVNGNIRWLPGKQPEPETRISVSYLCHPVFTVIEFTHLIRSVPFRSKRPPAKRETPIGDLMRLPIQVVARLEHLPLDSRSNA